MRKLKILTLIISVMILSLATGCLFKNSSNPVGNSSITESQQLAQTVAQVKPKVMASSYAKPPERSYTFSKCGHKIGHNFRHNVRKLAGSLRVCLVGADSTEQILISFEKMKVKPHHGAPISVNLDERTVDILSASDLADVLTDAELPEGEYRYMEFQIKDADVVVDGQRYNMVVPARKVRFFGKFEIKEGYYTNLKIKFMHRIIKWKIFGRKFYMLIPIVKISSELELKPVDPAITDGDVTGYVENFVDAGRLEGVNVSLDGTAFSAITGADGAFSFEKVPAGVYTLKANHPDYLDYSFQIEVVAGQVASTVIQLNPAVIRSNVANTGWFSEVFPFADANGAYGETSLETPVNIDFVSLAFTKAEIKFTGEYHTPGAAQFKTYLSSIQQVSADSDLGSWWVGNNAELGSYLGLFYAREEGVEYTVDVTDIIRNNPASAYFLAARNFDFVDIRMTNIQLSIYYR
ncbi:MAG: hypothetical protein Kow0029_08790 [Candidatus Rifleibacteriota bacterium]